MKKKLIAFYTEWQTKWSSIEEMAEHHDLDVIECQTLINIGRQLLDKTMSF